MRARTVENANRVLEMLAELRPAVEQALGERKDVAIEVWMGAMERAPAGSHGFTLRTDDSATIHLPDSADDERTTLAHELVHALRPAALEACQPILEEGLAGWIAGQVAPPTDPLAQLSKKVHVAAYFDAMQLALELREADGKARALSLQLRLVGEPEELEPAELFALCDRGEFLERMQAVGTLRGARFYAVAELCVERLVARNGPAAVRELARRAEREGANCIPWPWIAQAAGLERREDWLAASWSRLTAEDVRSLAESQPGLIVAPLAALCAASLQPRYPSAHGVELLRLSAARLVFASGEPLPLAELAPLVEALERPDQPPTSPN